VPACLQVAKMLSCWEGEVVVTSSIMPSALAKSMLEGGAKAVVCREGAPHPREAPQITVDFFVAFYQVLLSGRPVVQALAHAGEFCLAQLRRLPCSALSHAGNVWRAK